MNERQQRSLLTDALNIWLAGVEAVKPSSLFKNHASLSDRWLTIGDEAIDVSLFKRIVVVGAGKASAAMAIELESQCLSKLPRHISVVGWINAPEGSFAVGQQGRIHLHAARPAGLNIPTQQAVEGTKRIVELVSSCGQNDLCIVLLSGGGSALLVAPIEGISLIDKQLIAKRVAASGGNINQLNAIRRAVSSVKGGKLARACTAGLMLTVIVSDVLGDPLETIASGPTYESFQDVNGLARQALRDLGLDDDPELRPTIQRLKLASSAPSTQPSAPGQIPVKHIVLANNATAVDACGVKAVELGYRYVMRSAVKSEGDVAGVAKSCAEAIVQMTQQSEIDCWISGGEPTVTLPSENCGKGGRNQQLALLTLSELLEYYAAGRVPMDFAFLSGGTDGEDGPTVAAGAMFGALDLERTRDLGLAPHEFARRADAYTFFERLGGLVHTGPTGTNVCDVRIALVARTDRAP